MQYHITDYSIIYHTVTFAYVLNQHISVTVARFLRKCDEMKNDPGPQQFPGQFRSSITMNI